MKRIYRLLFTAFLVALVSGCATRSSYLRLDQSLQSDVRNIKGYQYLPLTRLCDAYGLNCKWDTIARTATVTGRSNTIVLRSDSDRVLINGVVSRIDRPAVFCDGALFVPVSFARYGTTPVYGRAAPEAPVATAPEAAAPKRFSIRTIVLDTGHGGKDAGAVGKKYGSMEKDIALILSKKVKEELESRGIRVIMTRSGDNYVSLEKRTDVANKSSADIFVSIHVNASRSRSLRGFECYYLSNATDDNARALEAFEDSSLKLDSEASAEHSSRLDKTLWDMALTENRAESGELAGYICRSVEESSLINNRGVRTARFYVLKHTHIPSVLVEAGYISHGIEEQKLKQPQFLDSLADAIARGILRYKERYENTDGFTNV